MIPYNKKIVKNSKILRKNMTKQERHLWYDFLKSLPVTVHRQKVIGDYIVDFYIACAKTVIEIDGSQHYLDIGMQKDILRDDYLKQYGLQILRYSNKDIDTKFSDVCQDILAKTKI